MKTIYQQRQSSLLIPAHLEEDEVTINYWRMGIEGSFDHFCLQLCVQVAKCSISWTMDMQLNTSHVLVINGSTIRLVADAQGLGIERRNAAPAQFFVFLVDNDNALLN